MIVWDRNSGISRADTTLPTNPIPSSTIPQMNAGVSAAAMVAARVGAPVAVTVAPVPLAASAAAEPRAP